MGFARALPVLHTPHVISSAAHRALWQPFKLFVLLGDPIGVSRFVLGAGERGRLFNQLPDVVARDGNAPVEFRERKRAGVAHDGPQRSRAQNGWRRTNGTGTITYLPAFCGS